MRVAGVVVAAGRGDRVGGVDPKQFVEIGGATLVERAVSALSSASAIEGVVVVVPATDVSGARAEALRARRGVVAVVAGGPTRAASVRNGIEVVRHARFVVVHDAARPFASRALVEAVIEATVSHGAAVPVLPIADTVKEDDGRGWVVGTVDRSRLRLAQTPQGCRTDWLLESLEDAARAGVEVTDEAAALERLGHPVRVVSGDPLNAKITTVADLEDARRKVQPWGAGARIGSGFDVHRFAHGRTLVLGGVEFPGETGLAGHSDADVVLHAAMDAVLGAAALGDIGIHFPPEDPRFAGARSTALVREVLAQVLEAGYSIGNLDVTVLAERPRIRGRVEQMRASMAQCFGISLSQVSVKATTLERLGSLGREEGIACQAVALVFRSGNSP